MSLVTSDPGIAVSESEAAPVPLYITRLVAADKIETSLTEIKSDSAYALQTIESELAASTSRLGDIRSAVAKMIQSRVEPTYDLESRLEVLLGLSSEGKEERSIREKKCPPPSRLDALMNDGIEKDQIVMELRVMNDKKQKVDRDIAEIKKRLQHTVLGSLITREDNNVTLEGRRRDRSGEILTSSSSPGDNSPSAGRMLTHGSAADVPEFCGIIPRSSPLYADYYTRLIPQLLRAFREVSKLETDLDMIDSSKLTSVK